MVLNTLPTATVTVTITGDSQVNTSDGSLTFTTANWNVTRTITVTAVDDALYEGPHTGRVTRTVIDVQINILDPQGGQPYARPATA